jgi:DnaK suppressor protein
MATKTKAPAKSSGAEKTPAKTAAKAAPKVSGKADSKLAAKPAPKAAQKTAAAKPASKTLVKSVVAKKAAKAAPAVKVAPKAAPKAGAGKAAAGPAKTESNKSIPARTSTKLNAKAASGPSKNPNAVASAPATMPLPPPKPPVRLTQPVSPKDLASAHEYLLTRSAGRSGEPVIVDGKPLLTEEQLLAMPEAQYMNSEQLAFFRYQLQQIERELLSNADETTEHLRETVIVPDPADRATIEEEHALELRTRDRERKLLKKVQGSLAQIEAGEYGYCEETGDPIGIPRLLARPTATLSLEAQQRREIKQKLFGD